MYKIFIFLFCIISATYSHAKIKLKIDIVSTVGRDKGIILVSELHSIEMIENRGVVKLMMKNGISTIFKAFFINDPDDYGPSPKVQISCQIFQDGELLKEYSANSPPILLGVPARYIYKDKMKKLIEITVVPESI